MTAGTTSTATAYASNSAHGTGQSTSQVGPSDYHHDRSGKHYAAQNYAPASNSTSGGASRTYNQERDSRSSRKPSGQDNDAGDSRRHHARSSRSPRTGTTSGSSRSRYNQQPFQGQSATGQTANFSSPQNAAPTTPGGTANASHASGTTGMNYDTQMSAQYNDQNATAVTPPTHDIQTNYSPHVSSSQSQGSFTQRRPAYLLHRDLVIGKGSYGQVCIASRGEAEMHNIGGNGKRKKFACKCVVLRNDAKYIAKLQEEVNVLRELRGHENVIRLYDVFCVDNELFIITELGRGGDLFHLLTTHPKHGVTEAYAAKTVAQMLSAVAFLHSRNICHRDLKLENWVLESGKDVWSPLKLIDFGLSTHFTPGHRLSRVVGSSYYVAPEVLKKSYTEACDLWSLGVIVYMLLSGAPPFYGKNDEAIKASIVQGEYTFPHELFRDVSDEAMAFVSTLLSYNIEYRYTAEQALTHPWLSVNCEPEMLQRAKDGATGTGVSGDNDGSGLEPMEM
eukprot:CAMPEP_0198254886 /NCGR_PEP_ID=MMETSP1447-20131203/5131_1 /TAXON_ID=420782 /ORGANISM="Chaetoceros dichaeta, Strain CCMP1751" /LENGTH=505 /DNA_ID=CAMNT_0043941117 /DNA_START=458 /DNA_END=1975 /DNA_ORIENTATION=+